MYIELINSKRAISDLQLETFNLLQSELINKVQTENKTQFLEAGKGTLIVRKRLGGYEVAYFRYPLHARVVSKIASAIANLADKLASVAKSFT